MSNLFNNNGNRSPYKSSSQLNQSGDNNKSYNSGFGNNPFKNLSPQNTGNDSQKRFNNKGDLADYFNKELSIRDKKIEDLEFEIKSMKNTLNLCVTLINDLKSKESQKQDKKPSQGLFAREQVSLFPNSTQPPSPINLFSNSNSSSCNLFNNSNSNKTLEKADIPACKNLPASEVLKNLCSSWGNSNGQSIFSGPDNFNVSVKYSENAHNANEIILENKNGAIKFVEPVNLSKISSKINRWASIENNNIGVIESELKGKKCEVVINDFCEYKSSTLEMKQNIVDRVSSLCSTPKFSGVNFDYQSGKLTLVCSGF